MGFTATSNSTPAKFDTVANFNAPTDEIDLSEIPGVTSVRSLGSFGAIPNSNIVVPNSVDWLINTKTNQTIVYVNKTATPETAQTASMEIVLNGQLTLSSSNFVLSEPPLTLTLASTAVTLPAGGSVPLPMAVSPIDLDDTLLVTISGLTSYKSITDALDHTIFNAGKTGSVTLTAAEVNSGLTLHLSYAGSGHPVNTLSVTATNTTPGETASTPPQNIAVTDPPPSTQGVVDTALAIQLIDGSKVGAASVGNRKLLEVGGPSSTSISFLGGTGMLKLDQSQSFAGQISGFGGQDQMDLADIGFSAHSTLGYQANRANTGGTLSVSDGTHRANLALLGQYLASSFAMVSDGHAGTMITEPAVLGGVAPLVTPPHA